MLSLLDGPTRLSFLRVAVLVALASVLELLSVGAVFPFMGLVVKPEIIESEKWLSLAFHRLGFENSRGFLIFVGLVMVLNVVLASLATLVATRAGQQWSGHVYLTIHERLLKKYMSKPYRWQLMNESSDLLSRLAAVSQVAERLFEPLVKIVTKLGSTALILVGIFVLDPLLSTFLSLILGGFYLSIYGYLRKRLQALGALEWSGQKTANLALSQAIRGIREIKVAGRESYFRNRATQPTIAATNSRVYRMLLSSVPSHLMRMSMYAGLLLVAVFVVARHPDPAVSVPLLSVYAMAGFRLLPALQTTFEGASRIKAGLPILEELTHDLADATDVEEIGRQEDFAPLPFRQGLKLEKVQFSYGGEREFEFSMEVPKGARIGITGRTGAGKSTLIAMICALLEPSGGQFLHDGIPLQKQDVFGYRRSIGLVPQRVFALHDTIRRNIAFGVEDSEIDDERIWAVLDLAQIGEFVRDLDHGLDTEIGEGGTGFSGGQLQRFGIARANYHDPEILILDEATSNLDPETEDRLLSALDEASAGKTIIIVSHRIESQKTCDKIYLLVDGKITESGAYEDLLMGEGRCVST